MGNTGADLDVSPSRYFHTERTNFNVTVGSTYGIFGMGIWETVLLVLVRDDSGKPSWLPIGLFDLERSHLPQDWEFVLLDRRAASGGDASNRWVAMWGYHELVSNRAHSDALVERVPEALEVFYRQAWPEL
jgi:hypothetical protein